MLPVDVGHDQFGCLLRQRLALHARQHGVAHRSYPLRHRQPRRLAAATPGFS
jgi:hypothetical protein